MITTPREPVTIKRRGAFFCEVDVTTTGSPKLPVNMSAYLIPDQAKPDFFAGGFVPARQRGSTYTFRAKVRMPETPGTYRLRVMTDYFRSENGGLTGNPSATPDQRLRFFDDGPLIQVN